MLETHHGGSAACRRIAPRTAWVVGWGLMLLCGVAGAQGGWAEFRPQEGKCSAKLPGTPQLKTSTLNSADGPVVVRRYRLQVSGAIYTLAFADYPEKVVKRNGAQQLLQKEKAGFLGSMQNVRPTPEKAIKLGAHPGLEFGADAENTISARFYLVGHRLYQLIAVSSKQDSQGPVVRQFLNSFRVL